MSHFKGSLGKSQLKEATITRTIKGMRSMRPGASQNLGGCLATEWREAIAHGVSPWGWVNNEKSRGAAKELGLTIFFRP
jgi:hypothetical protein